MTKYETYVKLIKEQSQNSDGFIEHVYCDSTLYSGLLGSIPDFEVDLTKAFDGEFWHRRTLNQPCCFDMENNVGTGSSSSISRDMLIGVAYWCWYNKRGDVAEQIVQHALKNFGFMGKANDLKTLWGRTQILPGLFSTFCWISYKLGGPMRPWALWIPADLGSEIEDYGAHIQVLHILLRKDIVGWNFPWEKQVLKYHAKRQPENPLYQIAVGNYNKANLILQKEEWWPSHRLPTNRDRKTHSIPMREPDYWMPDLTSPLEVHSGYDYVFCKWLMKRGIKGV